MPKPKLALAPLAVVAPVPPTAMARVVIPVSVEPESVTPLMVPPVMATALAFCEAMVPSEPDILPTDATTAALTNAVVAI